MNHRTTKEQKRNLKTSGLPAAIARQRSKLAEWEHMLTNAQEAIPKAEAGIESAQAKLDELEKRVIAEQLGVGKE